MNKIAKEKAKRFELGIIKRVLDYRSKKDLTKQELASAFGISMYLLNKLILNPDNSRLSVWKKVTAELGLKLSVK